MSEKGKKCCRACLKEIRNRTVFTNLLHPPDPIVQLRKGIEATSYLECYYYCLHPNRNNCNVENLSDYSYICGTCKVQLLKALEFIVQCQKNEAFLRSMYDVGKDASSSPDNSEHFMAFDEDVEDIYFNEEKIDVNEDDFDDDSEILKDDLIEKIDEVSHTSDVSEGQVEQIEDELFEEEHIVEEHLEEDNVEIDEGSTADELKNVGKTQKTSEVENKIWRAVPKKIFHLEFKCLLCRTTFDQQRQLYEHYDNEHDQESLTFPCDVCKRRHISQKALSFHKHSVHNQIPYKDCHICGQVILPAFFNAHKERHKKAVEYACVTCDRIFDRLCTAKQHYRAVHEKEKLRRYECPDCDRHFFSDEKLTAHRMVHDKGSTVSEPDFLCHICSKRFAKKIALQLHLKVHSGNIIKCPHCEKEFVRPKDMEYHMRSHTKDFPFTCHICSRGFAVRWSLDAHLKQHKGLRYKCDICQKEYKNRAALSAHSYIHRGFPLTCKICGKGYAVKTKLRVHLRNAHLRKLHGEYLDSAIDCYIVRNKIPCLYAEGQYLDEGVEAKT